MKSLEEIANAKRVPLGAILASKGINNPTIKGSELVFNSPFRNDSTPSFSVDTTRNVFVDFGESSSSERMFGGSAIDLIMKLENLSFPLAVDYLLKFDGTFAELPKYQKHNEKQKVLELLTMNDFSPLIDKQVYLYDYALSRGISAVVLETYCKEIVYRNKTNNQIYRAIGFKNDADGYELRYQDKTKSSGFKGCLGSKEVSTLQKVGFSSSLYLFEGFFSFLSWIQYLKDNNQIIPFADCIVLNTIAIANRVDYKKYKTVYSFLDNDIGGLATFNKLAKLHTHINFINNSVALFPNHKDFNDFIQWQNLKSPTVEN